MTNIFTVGQDVLYYHDHHDTQGAIDRVAAITKGGKIKLEKSAYTFAPDGRQSPCLDTFHVATIVPLTPELKREYTFKTYRNRLERGFPAARVHAFTDDQLVRLFAIINE